MKSNTTTEHESTDSSTDAELLTDDPETAQAFRRLLGGSVDLAADSVRAAFERSDSPRKWLDGSARPSAK